MEAWTIAPGVYSHSKVITNLQIFDDASFNQTHDLFEYIVVRMPTTRQHFIYSHMVSKCYLGPDQENFELHEKYELYEFRVHACTMYMYYQFI